MKNNELQNIDNYNKYIANNEMEIYTKYTSIIIQYLLFGNEKIKNQNPDYIKYILIKGIFTISYVFKMLLMYTCNLDLTYHHCQKSYSYYIEFIGQIGEDAVTYLQLNSKDAALFVYKKTIFDILDDIKKKYNENNNDERKNNNISAMIDIYNKLIETEIMQLNSEQLKTTEFINKMYTNIGHVNSKLYKLYYNSNASVNNNSNNSNNHMNENNNTTTTTLNINQDVFFKKLSYIKRFCDIIILKKISNEEHGVNVDYYKDYIKIIEYFIKKIRKMNEFLLLEKIDTMLIVKSFSVEFEEKIKLYSPLRFVNWIFCSD